MLLKQLPYIVGSIVLAGCSYTPTKTEIDSTHTAMSQDMSRRMAAIVPPTTSRPLVRHVAGAYLGLKTKPLGQDALLPPVFKESFTLNYPGTFTLRQVAEMLNRATGLPVNLKPDVFLPVSSFISGGIGQGSGAGGDATTAAAPGTGNGAGGRVAADMMKVNFIQTPLLDILNQINAAFGINFTYRDGEGITLSRMVTRTFIVTANAGDTGLTTSLGKSSGGGGGSTGAAGQGQNSGSANFSSTGTVTMNSTFSLWASLQGVVETIKTQPGKYFVNQATGTLTITDTKEVVDQVGRYIETQNAITTTQVGVRVELLTVTSNDSNELGVNWDAVFTKLNNLHPQWNLSVVSPATLASANSGAIGMSILTPPKDASNSALASLSGSKAMIDALQGFGRVTSKEAFAGLTLNRQPATLAKTTQTAYLARTVPGGTGGNGSSTLPGLEPGQVTTGFLSNVIPTILDNGNVLMQFAIDSSVLKGIDKQATGNGETYQAIQTPQVDALQTLQRVKLRSGGTLVLTGFEREVKQYDQRGITQHIALGGSRTTSKVMESIVILITPVILDGHD